MAEDEGIRRGGLIPPVTIRAEGGILRADIGEHTEKELDKAELEDRYAARLRALAEAKREEGTAVTTLPDAPGPGGADVIDLMEVLKRSLQGDEAGAREPRRAGRGDPQERLRPMSSVIAIFIFAL